MSWLQFDLIVMVWLNQLWVDYIEIDLVSEIDRVNELDRVSEIDRVSETPEKVGSTE